MKFRNCHDLANLAAQMVGLDRYTTFPSVYRLIESALILSVATASIEQV